MASYLVLLLNWDNQSNEMMRDQLCYGKLLCLSRNDYQPAYKLEADSIDEVFEVLNIRHPEDYKRRSLSVGDLVITPDSKVMFCASIGWKDVSDEISEGFRREMQTEINSLRGEREVLEEKYGQVWNTNELQQDFNVLGFAAPYVIVERKSDGKKGSLMFQHMPRYYFSWTEN